MEYGHDDQIINIVREWQNNQMEGTIIFSSSHLLKIWEERLLENLGYLGGIHLALFTGIIESITQTQAEERNVKRNDQYFLNWGIIQEHLTLFSSHNLENPWYLTGLVKKYSSVVKELKQSGIDRGEIIVKAGISKDIAFLMDEYQTTLNRLGVSDPDNALNEFNAILKQGNGPEYLKRVITVGFREFTTGQQQTIRLLEKQGQVYHFPLDFYDETNVPTLIEELRNNGVKIQGFTGSDREWEVRGIARTICQTMALGEKPENIVVVFRNLQLYHSYLKNIFSEYQIPWNEVSFFPWNQLPSLTSFRLWLRLFCGNIRYKDIWHLFVQFFTGHHGLLMDQWLTQESTETGKEKTLEQWADWLNKRADESEEPLRRKLNFLAEKLMYSPGMMMLSEYWRLGWDWLNITREPECFSKTDTGMKNEKLALLNRANHELCFAWERWMQWTESLGWNNITVTPETYLSLIDLLCSEEKTTLLTSHNNGVLVTIPSEIKAAEFSTVFIAGLVEGEFPKVPYRSDLIQKENIDNLRLMGFSTKTVEEYAKVELRAFTQLLRAATQDIYVSCPVMEMDGKMLSPSPFLVEIHSSLQDEAHLWPHYTPAQRFNLEPISSLEYSLKNLSKRITPSLGLNLEIIAGIQAEAKRRAGDPLYKGYPGISGEITLQLSRKFNKDYPFSPSAMKEYAQCPFGFFCKRVLRIEPMDIPGPLPTPSELGSVYHEILRKFFENHRNEPIKYSNFDHYMEEILKISAESFAEELESIRGEEDLFALRLLQMESMKENLRYFLIEELHWQEKINWQYLPYAFELSFGGDTDSIQLRISDGDEQVRLVGKIDRIDIASDKKSFIIFDYKTGNVPSQNDIANGLDLQMPIYIMAAELLFQPAEAMAGGYCSLKKHERTQGLWRKTWTRKCGYSLRNAKEDDDWFALIESSKKYLIQYGHSIRIGDFRPTAGPCGPYCSYSSICRRAFTGGLEDEIE